MATARRTAPRVSAGAPVVLYDGECRFCRACAALLAAWARRGELAIVPFRDPLGRRLTAALAPERREATLHVAGAGGTLASGAGAVRCMLGRLPGGRPLRAVAAHRLYDAVAGRRAWLGRCVPDRAPVRRPPPPGG